jgi:hypothetical protein
MNGTRVLAAAACAAVLFGCGEAPSNRDPAPPAYDKIESVLLSAPDATRIAMQPDRETTRIDLGACSVAVRLDEMVGARVHPEAVTLLLREATFSVLLTTAGGDSFPWGDRDYVLRMLTTTHLVSEARYDAMTPAQRADYGTRVLARRYNSGTLPPSDYIEVIEGVLLPEPRARRSALEELAQAVPKSDG